MEGGVERGGLEVEGGHRRATDGTGGTVVERTLETLCAEGVLAGDDCAGVEEELVADVAGELLLKELVVVLGVEGDDIGEGDVVPAVRGGCAEGTGIVVCSALGVAAEEGGRVLEGLVADGTLEEGLHTDGVTVAIFIPVPCHDDCLCPRTI